MATCKICSKDIEDKYKGGIGICYDCNTGWIISDGDKTKAEEFLVDFAKFKGWDVQTIPHNALYMKELAGYIVGRIKKESDKNSEGQ